MTEYRPMKNARTAYQVPEQFPSIYRDEGPHFVEFVRAYYAWLDSSGPAERARRLAATRDVDETDDDQVPHFVKKYLHGVPTDGVGDRRFLVKHALDVYRAKGSEEGIRLLFRLLYDETPTVYYPSRDVLRPSSGKWVTPKYFEVTHTDSFPRYAQAYVVGSQSGATAIVERCVINRVRGRSINVMYLSNVVGDFAVNERVLTDAVALDDSPYILGSVTGLTVIEGEADSAIGLRYAADDSQGTGLGLRAKATVIKKSPETNLTVSLSSGGHGYTTSTPLYVVALALVDDSGRHFATEDGDYLDMGASGDGAAVSVGSVGDTVDLAVTPLIVAAYENDALDQVTISVEHEILTENHFVLIVEESPLAPLVTQTETGTTPNANVIVSSVVGEFTMSVGTIESLTVSSLGGGYMSNPHVIAVDEFVESLEIPGDGGEFWGTDAVIDAILIHGENFLTGMKVYDSGFGYSQTPDLEFHVFENEYLVSEDELTRLSSESGEVLYWGRTPDNAITVRPTVGAVGVSVGYWENTDSFLNSDKYIQDSYYYQEFSYDVQSSKSLDAYGDVMRAVTHPVGSELFGTAVVGGTFSIDETHESEVSAS